MIALLNLSVLGSSFVVPFVFHDKAKRTQQGNLLAYTTTSKFVKGKVVSWYNLPLHFFSQQREGQRENLIALEDVQTNVL